MRRDGTLRQSRSRAAVEIVDPQESVRSARRQSLEVGPKKVRTHVYLAETLLEEDEDGTVTGGGYY